MHVFTAIAPVVFDDPCVPNPCGPNSHPPRIVGSRCQCTCLPEMIGSPPNCRPECVINSECPSDKACINRKCQDPCPGLCGVNAYCSVRNHIPICICNQGYIGDPFSSCYRPTSKTILFQEFQNFPMKMWLYHCWWSSSLKSHSIAKMLMQKLNYLLWMIGYME